MTPMLLSNLDLARQLLDASAELERECELPALAASVREASNRLRARVGDARVIVGRAVQWHPCDEPKVPLAFLLGNADHDVYQSVAGRVYLHDAHIDTWRVGQ